jgi:hypothetical protein
VEKFSRTGFGFLEWPAGNKKRGRRQKNLLFFERPGVFQCQNPNSTAATGFIKLIAG